MIASLCFASTLQHDLNHGDAAHQTKQAAIHCEVWKSDWSKTLNPPVRLF
jgi:hypothetical protein